MKKVKIRKSGPKTYKLTFRSLLVIVLISCLLIEFGKNAYENFMLKRNGIPTEAVVIKKTHVGAKGTINTYYEFMIEGKHYKGFSEYGESAEIGDTIDILYMKSNPNISKSCTFLRNQLKKTLPLTLPKRQ